MTKSAPHQAVSVESSLSPLWSIGFRPFFMAAGLSSASFLLLWLLIFTGRLSLPLGIPWHAHEMLLGFCSAVLAGFILTATQNWSGRRGLHGRPLQIMIGIWLLGRVGMLLPWALLSAGLDLLFIPALIYALIPYLGAAGQGRNRIFYLLLGLQFAGNLLYHLNALGVYSSGLLGLYLVCLMYLAMIALIGGRIIPIFTRNAVPEAQIKNCSRCHAVSIALLVAWMIGFLFAPTSDLTAVLALGAAAAHAMRLRNWDPLSTVHKPILWVLHLGYAWLVIGLFLEGARLWWQIPASAALHALTAGCIGVTMYAMLTRVSLGHTGRSLQASRLTVAGYFLINLAVILRVFIPWLWPALSLHSNGIAALCWVLAFAFYFGEYLPILVQARPDGKAG